jgi:hypothetical protein
MLPVIKMPRSLTVASPLEPYPTFRTDTIAL